MHCDNKKLEERVNTLEKSNKESWIKCNYLMNECYKITEKNKQLDKLISCLTSIFAIQELGGYREISGSDSQVPFKNESMLLLKGMLAESLKLLGVHFNGIDPNFGKKKSIMSAPPLITNYPNLKEEYKEDDKSQLEYDEEPIMNQIESPNHNGIRLNSPLPLSIVMSPVDSIGSPDPGMSVDPVPSYFSHEEIQVPSNKDTMEDNDNSISRESSEKKNI